MGPNRHLQPLTGHRGRCASSRDRSEEEPIHHWCSWDGFPPAAGHECLGEFRVSLNLYFPLNHCHCFHPRVFKSQPSEGTGREHQCWAAASSVARHVPGTRYQPLLLCPCRWRGPFPARPSPEPSPSQRGLFPDTLDYCCKCQFESRLSSPSLLVQCVCACSPEDGD